MDDPNQPFPGQDDDELILSIWEGDENAKGQIVMRFYPALERAIGGAFKKLHSGEVEDVVCEAIRRFWVARAKFDPAKFPLGACLYRTAYQVACEYSARRLKWQKARRLERRVEDATLWAAADRATEEIEDNLDTLEAQRSDLLRALSEEFAKLTTLEQDIWHAYADAGDFKLNSTELGVEMGRKHNGGVPYTDVNIRVIKHRAKTKLQTAMKTRGFDLKQMRYTND